MAQRYTARDGAKLLVENNLGDAYIGVTDGSYKAAVEVSPEELLEMLNREFPNLISDFVLDKLGK